MPDPNASRWVTVRVDVPATDADLVAGLLWSAGVAGIEERRSPAGPDGGVELWAGAELSVFDAVHATLGDRWPVKVHRVDGEAWLDEWRRWARAWRAGARLVVVPTWIATPEWVGADDLVIRLDPGRAFGSGAHASTRLCLAELEVRVACGDEVLDVGCGSGVLSVAAARLGAGHVEAIDIEVEAVRATIENAARNGVSSQVGASLTPLEEVDGRFPLVVANIGASTLVALAPELVGHTAVGGRIVVSGVLAEQGDAVTAALVEAGACPAGTAADGEWRALAFELPA